MVLDHSVASKITRRHILTWKKLSDVAPEGAVFEWRNRNRLHRGAEFVTNITVFPIPLQEDLITRNTERAFML
jgi:hypothetical protein